MYIVSLTYKASLEAIDKELNNHIDYLKKQYAAGNFLASGRKIPRNGGVILAKAQSREELDEILKQDPFNQNNLADYEVIEFVPSMTSKELNYLLEQ
ncbi:MAG: YciI family protein [Parabacteroides sp.]|nr:YciI family protein [Massilibacteroides sp.]MDD4404685.1 YciI family protein [Parabacteroides sp.]